MRNKLIEIENKLNILIDKMKYNDYLSFIKSNNKLNLYDETMCDYDEETIPDEIIYKLSPLFDEIIKVIDKKINEVT
ncbi:MAG: hypothetical protein ACI4WW_07740 [Candidatus Coprovivens sp.]